jgi:hypothetical protein
MPRYVVLYHQTPQGSERAAHWDLMLENDGILWTWALAADPRTSQSAQRLPDHRLAYLDYEGPISGDRGSVSRWDTGEYAVLELSERRIRVRLSGLQLDGEVRLSSPANGDRWDYEFVDRASMAAAAG